LIQYGLIRQCSRHCRHPIFRRTFGSTRVHRSPPDQARWPARASRRPGSSPGVHNRC